MLNFTSNKSGKLNSEYYFSKSGLKIGSNNLVILYEIIIYPSIVYELKTLNFVNFWKLLTT